MIKVCLLKYKPGYYWSKIKHDYFWSDDIGNQVWAHENTPLKTDTISLNEAVEFVKKFPGDCKAHRNAFMKFDSECFPIKDIVGMEKWTGIVYVDLDIDKYDKWANLDKEKHAELYSQLDYALQNILPDNYCYIEHSSSGIGIHCIFYFDCKRTIENFNKYAEYVYNVFRYDIDEYIKDFSDIFTDPSCLKDNGHSKVFDDIYNRPYQKFFMTGIDYKIYNVEGYCDNIDFQPIEREYDKKKELNTIGEINISGTSNKQYSIHYYDRLYILTALKRYCEKETARRLWYDFCKNILLYDNYKTKDFINDFDRNWDKIDASKGHLSILKKYGFNVDDRNIYYKLSDNQYLGDVTADIVDNCDNGLNMIIAGTGIGKTQGWINLNDRYLEPMEIGSHKPVLVIEPLNSIIDSKYDEMKFRIVTGSKQIGNLTGYEMIITNYNHLVRYSENGYTVVENINDVFSRFELVIIDESHIMMKDAFRAEVLIPFLISLRKVNSTKIIIQTATPMIEDSVLDIKKKFHVSKESKIKNKIIFRRAKDDFKITDIFCLVNYYISNGKKVYVYWSNGSLQNMNMFKKLWNEPEKVAIYHKRNNDADDMQWITKEHNIEKYNVLISSVFFGVGNDLLDELDDVATIIIGNNTWEEDIQADGRWRNVNSNETCVILLDDVDEEYIEKFSDIYDKIKYRYELIYKDRYNKDKSVIVGGKAFKLKTEEYVDILSKMEAAIFYNEQFAVKCKEFEKLGYDVRKTIKPLVTNADWNNEIKKYKQDLNDIHNTMLKDMFNNIFNWCEINKDSKLERCARIIKKLINMKLVNSCDLDKMNISKIMRYGTYLKYYERQFADLQDYAELFSILWTREKLKQKNKDTYKVSGIELEYEEYVFLYGYLIWISYRNKNDNEEELKYEYFYEFKKTCEDFSKLEQNLIERLFINNYWDDEFNDFYREFFGISGDLVHNSKNITEENLFEQIKRINLDEAVIKKNLKMILDIFTKKVGGKTGGKNSKASKKCEITDQFRQKSKYSLQIGQVFESAKALSDYTGKSIQTISQWRNKGWIK